MNGACLEINNNVVIITKNSLLEKLYDIRHDIRHVFYYMIIFFKILSMILIYDSMVTYNNV